MSAAPGLEPVTSRPRPRRAPAPSLALVPPGRPAPGAALGRTPFVALVVALLAAGLLGLLVLNIALAQDAFRLHTLKQDARALEDREQALQREVEALRAPQELAARATALGMVEAGPPAFLRLSDGAVLGADDPAEVAEVAQDAAGAVDPDVAPAEVAAAAEAAAEAAAQDEAAATDGPVTEGQATEGQATQGQPTEGAAAPDAPAADSAPDDPAAEQGDEQTGGDPAEKAPDGAAGDAQDAQ